MSRRRQQAKATSLGPWSHGSMRLVEGSGPHKTKYPPFNHEAAVRQFSSWVYAAAKLNAHAVSSTRLRLYAPRRGPVGSRHLWATRSVSRDRKTYLLGDGKYSPADTTMQKIMEMGTDFVEIVGPHPVLALLRTFNPFMNGFDQTLLRVLYQQLTGNAYLHVITDGSLGVPTELWPMPSQWVWIRPDVGGNNFIAGYTYGQQQNRMVDFAPEEVIHFKYPNPRDLFYGMGYVEAAWSAIQINTADHIHDHALMRNRARPDFAIIAKAGASEPALDRLEAKLAQMFRNPRNAGKAFAVSGDTRIVPLTFPPKDLVGRDDTVEEIAACFGTPVTLLKANDPNLASSKTGFAVWHETTTLPLCQMDEQVLNQSYIPLWGEDAPEELVLAYDNPVPEDIALRAERDVSYVNAGILTAEEVRLDDRRSAEPEVGTLRVAGVPVDSLGGSDPSATPVMPGLGNGVPRPVAASLADTVVAVGHLVGMVGKGEMPVDAARAVLTCVCALTETEANRILGEKN